MGLENRSPLLRLFVAILVAPPVALLIAGFAVVGDAMLLPPLMFGGLLVSYVAMILFGLPAHIILSRSNLRNGFLYVGAGVVAGILLELSLSVLVDPELKAASAMAAAGAICAAFFWLIRRPDRDQPPASSSKGTSA